ncbi:MAG: hypothetical protein ABTR92_18950 [Candidatus Accumulibacter phosphatis]|uniref:hypothetical protein n=1 Tax=Candidatus Accumulibacter sp. ACC012 TaxID=2823332 RepID=UPI0025C439E4|nr:hypothetical protein [Candidatus Accumulibacter sp. ACC012]
MTPQAALLELLARIGSGAGAPILVSEHELSQWPSAAVTAMKAQRLLTKARPARSVICPGCERECVMLVHTLQDREGTTAAFIVCDKRSDINRVEILADRLSQWQSNGDAVVGFVADALSLRRSTQPAATATLRPIGIASGNKRSQMLCLRVADELALVAGGNELPLPDLIEHRDGAFFVNANRVRHLVDAATTADPRYTPSNIKRDEGKAATQAMYLSWQKAYRKLARQRPNMPETWYAQQIGKMPIANGRDPSTIKKHMNP